MQRIPGFDFHGKTALVTGAGNGIGKQIAMDFVRHGMAVVFTSHSESAQNACDEMRREIPDAPVWAIRANIESAEERESLFCKSKELLGGHIDVLVNAAGMQIRHKPEDFPLEDFQKIIDVNLTAVFHMSKLVGTEMLDRGGRIINIASMMSFFGGITIPAYTASKGGVGMLTKALSNDWAPRGVTVNAIAPGYIKTAITQKLLDDPVRREEITSRIPMGDFGLPSDVSGAALFLASDYAKYVTGIILPVDGGFSAR